MGNAKLDTETRSNPDGGAQLPVTPDSFIRRDNEGLLRDFAAWRSEHSLRAPASFEQLLSWAESLGLEMTPEVLKKLHGLVTALKAKEQKDQEALTGGIAKEAFSWTAELARDVERTREARREQNATLRAEEDRRKKDDERHQREESSREQLRSLLLTKPISPDAASIRDLELRLLTKNFPAEDYMEVMQYLADLQRMHPSSSVRPKLGSAA